MTCIVGIKTGGGVVVGGDSALSAGDTVRKLVNAKVFRRGGFVIGCCDSLRVLQLVRYRLVIPPFKGKELHRYMVTDFVDSLRRCFKLAGCARKENEEEEVSGTFVIGVRDRLFIVNSDYSVEEDLDGMVAVGSGEEYAYGSLHCTSTLDVDDEARVLAALRAASYFCGSVGPPFTILRVNYGKKKRTKGEGGGSRSKSSKGKVGEKLKGS